MTRAYAGFSGPSRSYDGLDCHGVVRYESVNRVFPVASRRAPTELDRRVTVHCRARDGVQVGSSPGAEERRRALRRSSRYGYECRLQGTVGG